MEKLRLTDNETAFVQAFVATGNKHMAARMAGYKNVPMAASRNLRNPAILAEIARHQTERLFSDALPLAINCLIELVRNPKAPAGARVQAAKVIMDRTLGDGETKAAREPHEMTGEELARAIAELEAAAAARAKPREAEARIIDADQTPDLFA